MDCPVTLADLTLHRSQITITAEAWVSVESVARAYRSFQRQLRQGDKRIGIEKTLEVFIFVNGLTRQRGGRPSWNDLMREWNRAHQDHPKLQYRSRSSLRMAFERAKRAVALDQRLMDPRFRRRSG
jgi:hypothetical protein